MSSDISDTSDSLMEMDMLDSDDELKSKFGKVILPKEPLGVRCRKCCCCFSVCVYGMNIYWHVLMAFMLGILFNAEEEEEIIYKVVSYLYPSPLIIIPILNFVALVIGLVKNLWGAIAGLIVGLLNTIIYPYWIFWVSKQECCRYNEQIYLVYLFHGVSMMFCFIYAFDCVARYIRGIGMRALESGDNNKK